MELKMFMADDKTFPRLKGKAAEIKAIVPAVLELCSSKMDLMNAQQTHHHGLDNDDHHRDNP